MIRIRPLFFLAFFVLIPAVVHADMVEVKDLGIMNGTIVSEDKDQMKFKDAKGKMHTFKMKDVTFQEKEDVGKKNASMIKAKTKEVMEALKKAPETIQKGSQQLTNKYIAPLTAPLDRSGADAKSQALAGALDQANQASASGVNKTLTFNKEVIRQQNEAKNVAASAASDSKKGRYTSL